MYSSKLTIKKIAVVVTLMLIVAAVAWAAADSSVEQRGVLSGKVLADNLTVPGAVVREGDILVVVQTITGPIPAVRATIDGKVREVLVHPGDQIRTGDVLVRLEPSRK